MEEIWLQETESIAHTFKHIQTDVIKEMETEQRETTGNSMGLWKRRKERERETEGSD